MVVSEMGEQWSPHTAPAKQADIPIISRGSVAPNISVTMGIRIPKVPFKLLSSSALRIDIDGSAVIIIQTQGHMTVLQGRTVMPELVKEISSF
jgi:hypothetical protein